MFIMIRYNSEQKKKKNDIQKEKVSFTEVHMFLNVRVFLQGEWHTPWYVLT